MTRHELEALLTDLGNAAFDCGEWDANNAKVSYDEVYSRWARAKSVALARIAPIVEEHHEG